MSKINLIRIGSVASIACLPFLTFAAEFSTTTAQTEGLALISAVGVIMGAVIGVILGYVAGLMGLGWAKNKFSQYVTGGKF
jgi:hypothetical protein